MIKWKIRMLQPNRIAGFEMTAGALFCAFFDAYSMLIRGTQYMRDKQTKPEKALNFNQ